MPHVRLFVGRIIVPQRGGLMIISKIQSTSGNAMHPTKGYKGQETHDLALMFRSQDAHEYDKDEGRQHAGHKGHTSDGRRGIVEILRGPFQILGRPGRLATGLFWTTWYWYYLLFRRYYWPPRRRPLFPP